MRNLLEETIAILWGEGKTPSDVEWVGSENGQYAISWDEFKEISNVQYDAGFGGQEIISDLVVVGKDFWLSRGEYDGSEWWDYNTMPMLSNEAKPFSTVKDPFGASWVTIEEVHQPGGKYGPED
jgi:hypothetical protein